MIRVALLEHEKESKEVIFQLGKCFSTLDWTFRHFFKASDLLKRMKEEQYQIFIFDEIFKTPRMESVFVHDNPSALFLFLCKDPKAVRKDDKRNRVLYLSKDHLEKEIAGLQGLLTGQARQKEKYSLVCQGVKLEIPIEDIYYVHKVEKNVYFYTRKGEFHRRASLSDLEESFEPYGFMRVHVSYLVNGKYVTGIYKEELELNHEIRVPLSRAQKKKLGLQVRSHA